MIVKGKYYSLLYILYYVQNLILILYRYDTVLGVVNLRLSNSEYYCSLFCGENICFLSYAF